MSKDIKLNQRKRASLQQATVIIFIGIAAVIMLALLSYNPNDPGLFHRNANHVGKCANLAGCKGAWLADFLFGLLGYLAFAVPLVLVASGLTAFRFPKHLRTPANPIGGINSIITAVGAIFTLLAGSGLAHLLFVPYPVGIGGGVLGKLVAGLLTGTFLGQYGSLLLLLSLFLGGITLVGDISWVEVTEKVGDFILNMFDKVQDFLEKSAANRDAGRSGKALSVSKDLLKSSRNSVSKMGSLLNRVSALTPAAPALPFRKTSPLDQDLYDDQDDPLFDEPRRGHGYVDDSDSTQPAPAAQQSRVADAEPARHEPEPAQQQPQQSQKTAPASGVADADVKPKQAPPKKKVVTRSTATDAFPHSSVDSMITLPRLSLLDPPPPARERVTQTRE
ncbi:MAG: Cell division protein FtsK, partial [uncultured Thiotrichaceae bacterium]